MCKFKKGDKVVLVKDFNLIEFSIKEGTTGIVLDDSNHPFVQFDIEPNHKLHSAEDLGENGRCFTVGHYFLKSINADYHQSNRHKLHQAIKATGYSSRRLSDIAVGNESYFYNYTGKARFDKKGDITEDCLNSLLTTLAFAERELLGIGAKTVDSDKTYKPSQVEITIGDVEIKGALVEYYDNELDANLKAIDDSKINEQTKLYSGYFDSANKRIQQKKDSKVRNFLIVFLVFVVILSIYFFTR